MPLNNYFSFKRFSLLLQQDLLINRTKYLLGILGLGVITYLIMYFFLYSTNGRRLDTYNYINSYYVGFFIFYIMAVGVVIGTAFPDLKDKIKTTNYLLIPGSTFEKLLVQFVIRIGLFVPIALGLFWTVLRLVKASLVSDLAKGFDVSKIPYFNFRMLITNSNNNQLIDTWLILFMIFGVFSYGSYLFAGTTYFRRYALIKTVIFSAIVFGISILFMMMLSSVFYPQTEYFKIQLQPIQVTENLDSFKIAALGLTLFSWMFFLAIAYFKLKEKEA